MPRRKGDTIPKRFIPNKEWNVKVQEEANVSGGSGDSLPFILHNIYSNTRTVLVTRDDIKDLDRILEHQLRLMFKHSNFVERTLTSIITSYLQKVTCGKRKEAELYKALALLFHIFLLKKGKEELPNKYNWWIKKVTAEIVELCYRGMIEDCVLYFIHTTKDYPNLMRTWQRLIDHVHFYKEGLIVKGGEAVENAIDAEGHIDKAVRGMTAIEEAVGCNRKYLSNLIRNVRESYQDYLRIRNHIVSAYLKLAVKTATRMKGAIPAKLTADAIQEASLGILQAIRVYQPKNSVSMSSYVIKKATEFIVNKVLYKINVIKMPEGMQKNLTSFERAKREGSDAESLAKDIGINTGTAEYTLRNMVLVDSMYTPDGKDAYNVSVSDLELEEMKEAERELMSVCTSIENYSQTVKELIGLKFGITPMINNTKAEQDLIENLKNRGPFAAEMLKQIAARAKLLRESDSCKEPTRDSLLTEEILKTLKL